MSKKNNKPISNNRGGSNDRSATEALEQYVAYAPVEGFSQPVDVRRRPLDIPDSTKAITKPVRIQATSVDAPKAISRAPILATFFTNGPFPEQSKRVFDRAQILTEKAENYQRKFQLPYFAQYHDVVMTYDGSDEAINDANWLMAEYRLLCSRAAHKFALYENTCIHYAMALMNIIQLSRLEGEGVYGRLANMTKWAYINANTKRFASFVFPKGLINYLLSGTVIATGFTANTTPIVAYSYWRNAGFGNVGQHTHDFNQALEMTGGDYVSTYDRVPGEAMSLLAHMGQYVIEKSVDTKDLASGNGYIKMKLQQQYKRRANGQDIIPTMVPTDPHIANGSQFGMYGYGDDDHETWIKQMEYSASNDSHNQYISGTNFRPGEGIDYDNLGSRAWDTYKYWEAEMLTYFGEFADPNSDWVRIALECDWFERSPSVENISKTLREAPFVDIYKVRDLMQYKRDNAVTTATIIEPFGILDGGKVTEGVVESCIHDEATFKANFQRYLTPNLRGVSMTKALQSALKWPRLTPTLFTRFQDVNTRGQPTYPLCLNALSQIGANIVYPGKMCAQTISGRNGTIFDHVCCGNTDASSQTIETVAMDPDWLKQYFESNNGVVFVEDPSNVWAMRKPYIDSTDPLQTGFYVVLDSTDQANNEWTKWLYKDPDFSAWINENAAPFRCPPIVTSSSDPRYGIPPMDVLSGGQGDDGSWAIDSWSNKAARDHEGTGLVFVGDGIFMLPELTFLTPQAGVPVAYSFIEHQTSTPEIFTSITNASAAAKTLLDKKVTDGNWNAFDPELWQDVDEETGDTVLAFMMALTALAVGSTYDDLSGTGKISARAFMIRAAAQQWAPDGSADFQWIVKLVRPDYGNVVWNIHGTPRVASRRYDPYLDRSEEVLASELKQTPFQRAFDRYVFTNAETTEDDVAAIDFRRYFGNTLGTNAYKDFLWFITRVMGTIPTVDADTGAIIIDQSPFTVQADAIFKAPYRLINATQFKFVGISDDMSVWDAKTQERMTVPQLDLGAGPDIPQLEVLVQLPKVKKVVNPQEKPSKPNGMARIPVFASVASWLSGAFRTSKNGGDEHGRNKGKENFKRKDYDKQSSNKGAHSQQEGKPLQNGELSNTYDASSKETDDKMKSIEKNAPDLPNSASD